MLKIQNQLSNKLVISTGLHSCVSSGTKLQKMEYDLFHSISASSAGENFKKEIEHWLFLFHKGLTILYAKAHQRFCFTVFMVSLLSSKASSTWRML